MQPYRKFTNSTAGSINAALGPTPASSTDNAIVRWDGTTGRLIQDSVVSISDVGFLSGVTEIENSGGDLYIGGNPNVIFPNSSLSLESGIIAFGGFDPSTSAIINTTNRNGTAGLRIINGDISTSASIVASSLQLGGTSSSSTTDHKLLYDAGNNELTLSSNQMMGWGPDTTNPYVNADTSFTRAAPGVVSLNAGRTTAQSGWLQTGGFKRKTADQTVTNSTTLVDDSHLTVSLAAGRSYKFKFVLFASVRTGNQVKVCLSGTATHTHLISSAKIYDSSTLLMDLVDVVINTTPGNHLYASNTLPTDEALIEIEGTTTVNAAGTFLLQFAEVTAGIGSDVILRRGSTLEVWDVA